ncbi:MAG: hypothetical protein K2K17_09385 [Lachnospiraceae bacterium]|nr:hypothetical protein [Lachnospiraceae bacterium]
MIHIIIVCIDQIGKLYKFISLCFQIGDQGVQSLCGIFCAIVAEDNGTVAQMLMIAYCGDDGIYAVIFPVKAVNVRNKNKYRFFKVLNRCGKHLF